MDGYYDKDYESDSNSGISINFDKYATESDLIRSDSLYFILNEIKYSRLTSKSNFSGNNDDRDFWLKLFHNALLQNSETSNKDDLLFFVLKNSETEVDIKVFRKNSPRLGEMELCHFVNWEETVYLNLIIQQFTYILTVAVVTRTGPQEYQILRKVSERVYASPSKRQMDSKGTGEQITYPNIYFTVDSFEEVFSECVVRDSESVCVELTAFDHKGALQAVIFLGTVRYNTVKSVYDSRNTQFNRLARHTASWFKSPASSMNPVEFVKMLGPDGKGHAQLAVGALKYEPIIGNGSVNQLDCFGLYDTNSSMTTSLSNASPLTNHQSPLGLEDATTPKSKRRTSDQNSPSPVTVVHGNKYHGDSRRPSSRVADLVAGGNLVKNVLNTKMKKSQSDGGTFETSNGIGSESELNNAIYCEDFEEYSQTSSSWGQSFNQAWYWFKERRKASSAALTTSVTYISLPWYRIVADILDKKTKPILTFDRVSIAE